MQETNERKYLTDEEVQALEEKKALTEEELRTLENIMLKVGAMNTDPSIFDPDDWEALVDFPFCDFLKAQPLVVEILLKAKDDLFNPYKEDDIRKFIDSLLYVNRAITVLNEKRRSLCDWRALHKAYYNATDRYGSEIFE